MSSKPRPEPERVGSEPPRFLFRLLNPVMRAVLRSPAERLVSGRLMLMNVTGRTSGKTYSVPVGYARVGDVLYTGTGGRWASNLRGGAPVEIILRGRRQRASAELISDLDGMVAAYTAIHAASPGYANALARATSITFGPDGEVQRDEVARAQTAGHVIIRTTLGGRAAA